MYYLQNKATNIESCILITSSTTGITKIADDLVEDEIVISPIYKMVKEYPEDTEKDIYQRLN